MNLRIPAVMVLGLLVGLLAMPGRSLADPAFEEIDVLKTIIEPCGEMVNGGDGYFYGAARWAQGKGGGAIFRLAPGQDAEVLYTFATVKTGADKNYGGSNPSCAPVFGANGALYGATDTGGAYANGTIYRLTADGTFSVLYDLRLSDGQQVNSLVYTSTGELFGTTDGGGTGTGGTMFHFGADGVFQVVYDFVEDFSDPSPEVYPPALPRALREGSDGNVYGMTSYGGPVTVLGRSRICYGTFFRYEGPGAITVLSNFDAYQSQPTAIATSSDGFYVATERHLLHLSLDGEQTILAELAPAPQALGIAQILPMPDGVYGLALLGGANLSGFVFRFVPEQGLTVLHDFSTDYTNRDRCLVVGNDGLIYGIAAFPEGYSSPAAAGLHASTASVRMAMAVAQKGPQSKPRTFRFRELADQSANFVPVAKPDTAWLPAGTTSNKQRSVIVDVLANDRDPDKNPLTLTGVVPPSAGFAELVSTAGKLRVHFVTSEVDPESRCLLYHIADGKGGTAVGNLTIYSLATGNYGGTATDTSTPPASPGVLTVTIGEKNAITANFVQNKHRYSGKGTLAVDDTAAIVLTVGSQPPLNMHLAVQRGTPRRLAVTIQGGGSIYTTTCPQTGK